MSRWVAIRHLRAGQLFPATDGSGVVGGGERDDASHRLQQAKDEEESQEEEVLQVAPYDSGLAYGGPWTYASAGPFSACRYHAEHGGFMEAYRIMKPNDTNGHLPPNDRPFRVLLVAGSGRRQYNCPGVDSKARTLMLRMADRLPKEWEIDYEDLGNVFARARIQSCNACVSTSMALCVWPCNCYAKGNSKEPDLMWDLDLYARLDLADAWAFISPVNWYGPTSNLKLFFDRLVCMNGGNPREDLIKHKDPELAMALEHTPEFEALSVNHLEGRTAAFFCYGDGGGDEMNAQGRPELLRHPEYFDPSHEPFADMRQAYAPLVWQCRYGGIEVPEPLWTYAETGRGKKYSDNQAEDLPQYPDALAEFDAWAERFAEFVAHKGRVTPGTHRAFGYEAPGHLFEDLQLLWRDRRMRFGLPREGSSPQLQQDAGLNRDATHSPDKGEGEKLRE